MRTTASTKNVPTPISVDGARGFSCSCSHAVAGSVLKAFSFAEAALGWKQPPVGRLEHPSPGALFTGLRRQPRGSQPFPAVAADFGVSQDRTAEAVLSNQPSEVRQHPSHCVLANRRCKNSTSFERKGGRLQILIHGVSNNLQTV